MREIEIMIKEEIRTGGARLDRELQTEIASAHQAHSVVEESRRLSEGLQPALQGGHIQVFSSPTEA